MGVLMYIYSSTLLPFFISYFISFRAVFRLAWMLNLFSKAWFPIFWLAFAHASFVFVPSRMCFFSCRMFYTHRFSTLKEVTLILFLLFGLNNVNSLNVCAQFEWEPLHRVSAGEKRCLQKKGQAGFSSKQRFTVPDVGFCPHSTSQSHRCHFIWKLFVEIDVWIWSRWDKSEEICFSSEWKILSKIFERRPWRSRSEPGRWWPHFLRASKGWPLPVTHQRYGQTDTSK